MDEADEGIASEKCHQEKRKTVNGEDIIFAMTSLGFENYAEVLKIYLAKYRQVAMLSGTELTYRTIKKPPRRLEGRRERGVRAREWRMIMMTMMTMKQGINSAMSISSMMLRDYWESGRNGIILVSERNV
jgi:hypothetical protein